MAAPAFAPPPASVVFEPEPAATVFDPGPAPADLESADLAAHPIEAALEPVAFENLLVSFAPAPLAEQIETGSAAIAEPSVEAVESAEVRAAGAMPALHDVQEKARLLVEKSLAETRAHFVKAKCVADEATSALEASLGAAKTGAVDIRTKALATIQAQAEANFEFFKSVVAVKSLSDYVALQTEFARKQIEAMTTHGKEMRVLAQKVANDAAEPIKAHWAKTLNIAV